MKVAVLSPETNTQQQNSSYLLISLPEVAHVSYSQQ